LAQRTEYWNNYKKKQRQIEKQLSIRYNGIESKAGETFTSFKYRMKKQKAVFSLAMFFIVLTSLSL